MTSGCWAGVGVLSVLLVVSAISALSEKDARCWVAEGVPAKNCLRLFKVNMAATPSAIGSAGVRNKGTM